MSYEALNQAMSSLGSGIGNVASEYHKQSMAKRQGYLKQAIAAQKNGDTVSAHKYAALADPDNDLPELDHLFANKTVPLPDQAGPMAGMSPSLTPGAPAPTATPAPVPSWNNPMGGTAASLPSPGSLAPGIGNAPSPGALAPQVTDGLQPEPKWMGVNPRRIGLGAGEETTERVDMGIDPKSQANVLKMLSHLGVERPEAKVQAIDGYGLMETKQSFAGLPAEATTMVPERIGTKDAAALRQHANETAFEWKNRIAMANQDDATKRWVAMMGDSTDRWKANLASRVKSGDTPLEQAQAMATIEEKVRKEMPRGQNKITGEWTEDENAYESRIEVRLKPLRALSGVNMSGYTPPAEPAPPAATLPPDWKGDGRPAADRVSPLGTPSNPLNGARPAPPAAPTGVGPSPVPFPKASPAGSSAVSLKGLDPDFARFAQTLQSTLGGHITSGYSETGHAANGYHPAKGKDGKPNGLAVDFVPNASEDWAAAVSQGLADGKTVRYEPATAQKGAHLHFEPAKGAPQFLVEKSPGVYVPAAPPPIGSKGPATAKKPGTKPTSHGKSAAADKFLKKKGVQ